MMTENVWNLSVQWNVVARSAEQHPPCADWSTLTLRQRSSARVTCRLTLYRRWRMTYLKNIIIKKKGDFFSGWFWDYLEAVETYLFAAFEPPPAGALFQNLALILGILATFPRWLVLRVRARTTPGHHTRDFVKKAPERSCTLAGCSFVFVCFILLSHGCLCLPRPRRILIVDDAWPSDW